MGCKKVRRMLFTAVAATALAVALAPAASAREQVLTLYSPRIDTLPYVHDTHNVILRPNGREAPAVPGYITQIERQDLVDSKRPGAPPIPPSKMMVHHFLIFAPGRVDQAPGSCWGQSGFIGGRGEEHPNGRLVRHTDRATLAASRLFRARYGITNRTADGRAPAWRLTAMVMNHFRAPKAFYVRLTVRYVTGERRTPITPIVVGNCAHGANGMAYDVPGGGGPGSEFVDRSRWTAPPGLNGRIVSANSHHHGGAKYHTLRNVTCGQSWFKAPAYHGTRDHIYNTIRPILHEPGPIGNGAYATLEGIPIHEGDVLERAAVHDNSNLHVAAMGFWVLQVALDPAAKRCGGKPADLTEINRPARYDPTPNHGLVVPQLAPPRPGPMRAFSGSPLAVGDQFFQPGRVVARVGEPVTWAFRGQQPHSVTVANGPRGFSSNYLGRTTGTYSFTPKVRGTYRLTCLIHPTTMGQTLVVR